VRKIRPYQVIGSYNSTNVIVEQGQNKDALETFLDVKIRVAEQSYAFKTKHLANSHK
jgi:hypothetical protein